MFPRLVLTTRTQIWYLKPALASLLCLLLVQAYLFKLSLTDHHVSTPTAATYSFRLPGTNAYGSSQCLPGLDDDLVRKSIAKQFVCKQYSPFSSGQLRVGTVTAHFGGQEDFEREALGTHLVHSVVHGTDLHVLCDPLIDDLWNKPAILLNVLMLETLKPRDKRLHWIMWVDRDTLILDQCRPMSSFLPPEPILHEPSQDHTEHFNSTHLVVTDDFNGLNNGVFFVRVNSWAIELFAAILAFRHFEPDVELRFTEQSAMEEVIKDPRFSMQVQRVPQYWFNGYTDQSPQDFKERVDTSQLSKESVRRGDYLVHFAGKPEKREAIKGWLHMLEDLQDVWKENSIQRDVTKEVNEFWSNRGFPVTLDNPEKRPQISTVWKRA